MGQTVSTTVTRSSPLERRAVTMEQRAGPIVVVEDDSVILGLMRDALVDEGFSVLCAERPGDAVHMLREVKPALFLVDIMLPDISGMQLAKELRNSSFPTTPMVAMSASPFIVDTVRKSGLFQEVLAKPFDFEELLTTICRYVP